MEERFIERRFEAIDKKQEETEQTLEKHTGLLQDISTEQKSQSELLQKILRRQDEHAKALVSHSRSVSTLQTSLNKMATKDDLKAMATKQDLTTLKTAQDAHFDQIEAEQKQQHQMLRQILRLLGQQPDEEHP